MPTTVEALYSDLWGSEHPQFDKCINTSLGPRTSSMLYDVFASFGVAMGHTVADIGCRAAVHSVELVRRFGCRIVAIDPVALHVKQAQRTVEEAGLHKSITVVRGRIEALPLKEGSIDHLWLRDVTSHVDLPIGFRECRRVLKPGGEMLVYQTFATELCEPKEYEFLCRSMAIQPDNLSQTYFEQTAGAAGLEITAKDEIGSEWREHWLEQGDTEIVDGLLRIARMRRLRETLILDYGPERYEAAFGSDLWGIYQLLGKLCPTVYSLRRP